MAPFPRSHFASADIQVADIQPPLPGLSFCSSPTLMPALDWAYYPHIRDLILDAAPDDVIPSLRLTQRSVREYLDRRLANHILYVVKKGRLYTRVGHIQLAFQTENIASRIEAIDVYPPDLFEPHDAVGLHLPNLRYARLPCIGDLYNVLPKITSAPQCVIQAVLPKEAVEDVTLNFWVSKKTQKMVFVLPRRLSALRCRNVHYSPALSDVHMSELVIVLLPGLDNVWDENEEGVFIANRFKPDYLQSIMMECLRVPGSTLTLVGLEGLNRKIASETTIGDLLRRHFLKDFHFKRAVWPENHQGRRLHLLSLEEWKAQVPAQEWGLVSTLPECILDPCAR